jgi:tetratricopeptide (TPR) repeat protein
MEEAVTPLAVEAEELVTTANADPRAAVAAADELLARPEAAQDTRACAVAWRARGLAAANLMQLDQAVESLEAATAAAVATGDPHLLATVQMTQGGVLSWAGESGRALTVMSEAVAQLDGVGRARALVQRGAVHYRIANFDAALADFDAAYPLLEGRDQMWLGNLLVNRALTRAYMGSLLSAEDDLLAARAAYEALDQRLPVAQCTQNLGWLAVRQGDLPKALRYLDEAEEQFDAFQGNPAEVWVDRVEALLLAHLTDDAVDLAEQAADNLASGGHGAGHAEALIRVAQAALLAGQPERAEVSAREARRRFEEQDRLGWAAHADLLVREARYAAGEATAADRAAADRLTGRLESAGLATAAATSRVLAAQIALALGDIQECRRHLEAVGRERSEAAVDLRARIWLATAQLRRVEGDRRGALAAVAAGLDVVDEHQAGLGATETRVHAAGHARHLGALGVQLAWETQRPKPALRWMERTRAGALRFAPVTPPDDDDLALELGELREVERELRTTALSGDAGDLEERRRRLERAIRRRTRRLLGADTTTEAVNVDAVVGALDGRRLIEYAAVDDRLVAVSVHAGRARRHDLASVPDTILALDQLRFGLRRLARPGGKDASRRAAREMVDDAARRLDDLLLAPIGAAGEDLVVVPPGRLHAVPWGLLPSCVGRAVSVSPSAELWLRRADRGRPSGRSVIVGGPRLPGAPDEVAAVAGVYGDAQLLDVASGSVDVVRHHLDGAALAHLVCHGRFRTDNPLFSALEFGDGWFTVYEFERLRAAPQTVVLSACDAGLSAERPGNEVMGIVAGLLGAGTNTVIASIGLVPDAASTRHLMVDFHQRMAAGVSPADALAGAQTAAISAGDDTVAGSFVCFGAG